MTHPYIDHPGSPAYRGWSETSYSPHQLALWVALDDAYYTSANNQADTRQPSPHANFDDVRFKAWQRRVVERWEAEDRGRGRGYTRPITVSDWPHNLWLYLYERMVAADSLKNNWRCG